VLFVGVFTTFLYQWLSDPPGSRYRLSPCRTNHTGWEIARPDVRPVVVRPISVLSSKALSKAADAI
jgi:hypothetical protein